jgi:hypothetical protein
MSSTARPHVAHDEAEVIDTMHLTPAQAALKIAGATKS